MRPTQITIGQFVGVTQESLARAHKDELTFGFAKSGADVKMVVVDGAGANASRQEWLIAGTGTSLTNVYSLLSHAIILTSEDAAGLYSAYERVEQGQYNWLIIKIRASETDITVTSEANNEL